MLNARVVLASIVVILSLSVVPEAFATPIPTTTITEGPGEGARIHDQTPTFEFNGTDAESYECSYEATYFFSCESPYTLPIQNNGEVTFQVRAVNDEDVADPTPAERTFAVAHGPEIWIDDDAIRVLGEQDTYNQTLFERSGSNALFSNMTGNWWLTAGNGCSQLNDHLVACPLSGIETIEIQGGPQSDSFGPVQYADEIELPITIRGGGGGDYLTGGSGDDKLDGGAGADSIAGGPGTDVVDYSDRSANVVVTPGSGFLIRDDGELGEEDLIDPNVEGGIGGSGDDYFEAGQAPAVFHGGDGEDTFNVAHVSGEIVGGNGDDVIDALNGVLNEIDCGSGTDSLQADREDDIDTSCEASSGPPLTRIVEGPPEDSTTSFVDVPFRFATNVDGATFECSLDSGSFASCNQEFLWSNAANGAHEIAVRATHPIRGTDSTPDSREFTLSYSGAVRVDGGVLAYSAGAGVANNFQVHVSENIATISDLATIGIGVGCEIGLSGVECDIDGVGSLEIELGDGNDYANLYNYSSIELPMRIWGGSGHDSINGGQGDDELFGEDGSDTLGGFGGRNTIVGGPGSDHLFGGYGISIADYSERTAPVTANFDWNESSGESGEGDTLSGVSGVITGDGDDTIVGDSGPNEIDSGGGNDTIDPGDGDDEVNSGSGDDTITLYDGAEDEVVCGDDIDTAILDRNDTNDPDCETVQKPVDTWITGGVSDGAHTNSTSASFTFDSYSGTDFECSLDGATFATCTSPASYPGLSVGDHSFEVRAVTPTSEVDPTPAERNFVVVAKSNVSVTGSELEFEAPTRAINELQAGYFALYGMYVFLDSGNEITAGSGCMQAAPNYVYCMASSVTDVDFELGDENDQFTLMNSGEQDVTVDLGEGDDVFVGDAGETTVIGGDGNDNVTPGDGEDVVEAGDGDDELSLEDATEDSADCGDGEDLVNADDSDVADPNCESVLLRPETYITFGPENESTVEERDVEISFTSPTGDSFECRIDDLEWEECESPFAATDLTHGEHEVSVRALDGEVEDRTPAARVFVVNAADIPVSPVDVDPQADPNVTVEIDDFSAIYVDIRNGDYTYVSRDRLASVDAGWVGYDRYFNNADLNQNVGLGGGWSLSAGPNITLTTDGNELSLAGPGGYTAKFWKNSEGEYSGPPNFAGNVTEDGVGGFNLERWTDEDAYHFDSSGVLDSITTRDGTQHEVTSQSIGSTTGLASVGTGSSFVNANTNGQRILSLSTSSSTDYATYTSGELSQFTNARGAIEYSYAGGGLLTGIQTADDTEVSIDLGVGGEVESIEVDPADADPATTQFEYGDGETTVIDSEEVEHIYSWDENDGLADPPALQDTMIESLAESRDITNQEAAEHILIQNRSAGLVEALELELGSVFVSLSQDPSNGEMVINVTDEGASASVENILEVFGLSEDAVVSEVDFSIDELDSAFDNSVAELENETDGEWTSVGINNSENRVEIETGESISSGDQEVVDDLVTEGDGRIVAVPVDDDEFTSEADRDCVYADSSAETYTGCRRPLRGGIGIASPSKACSSAFVARTNSTNRLALLTAGHCLWHGSLDTSQVYTASKIKKSGSEFSSVPTYLGRPTSNGEFGTISGGGTDSGVIVVSKDSGFYKGGAKPWVAMGRSDQGVIPLSSKYVIQRTSRAYKGLMVCVSGGRRGQDCGEVTHTTKEVEYKDDGTKMSPMVRVKNLCLPFKGDSGSPMVRYGAAFGVYSGGKGCNKYFSPIAWVEAETDSTTVTKQHANVKIANARLRPGLTAELDHDIHDYEFISYSVNPHGSPTRIRVEVRNAPYYWPNGVPEPLLPASFSWTNDWTMPCVRGENGQIRLVATNDSGVTYGSWIDVQENCIPS